VHGPCSQQIALLARRHRSHRPPHNPQHNARVCVHACCSQEAGGAGGGGGDGGGGGGTIADYFRTKYLPDGLRHPALPCLRVGESTTRCQFYPLEVCRLAERQRLSKLSAEQTSQLIRYACCRWETRCDARARAVVARTLVGVL
jgi:hypothetical protein